MSHTALEQSFADLCATHGLTTVSINYTASLGGHFTAYVHNEGGCAGEHGNTIAEAIGKAVASLNAKPLELADEALPMGEAA